MAKKKTKKAPAKAKTAYDWTERFNAPAVRKAIVKMVKATACEDENCLLESRMSPDTFANTLITYIPKAYKYLPKGLVADEEKQKAIILLAELANKDVGNGWASYNDPDPNVACALLMLMSRGVKSLDFSYSGGWDETSYDESGPSIEYHDDAPPAISNDELWDWIKKELDIEAQEIFYKFLDDSGAGDGNTYSQMLLIDLADWKIKLHDYEEDESDDWDEEE